jgi:hypothetical protein
LAITALPRSFAKYPFSAPMMLIILGYVAVVLPFGLKALLYIIPSSDHTRIEQDSI